MSDIIGNVWSKVVGGRWERVGGKMEGKARRMSSARQDFVCARKIIPLPRKIIPSVVNEEAPNQGTTGKTIMRCEFGGTGRCERNPKTPGDDLIQFPLVRPLWCTEVSVTTGPELTERNTDESRLAVEILYHKGGAVAYGQNR